MSGKKKVKKAIKWVLLQFYYLWLQTNCNSTVVNIKTNIVADTKL